MWGKTSGRWTSPFGGCGKKLRQIPPVHFLTGSRNISYDMVCRAMHETGINLNRRFRETSEGGLAKIYERRGRK